MSTGQVALSAAYHLPVSENMTLSTGIRATVGRTTVDLNNEVYYDQLDPSIYTLAGPFIANIDLGTTLNGKNSYFGVSYKNVNRAEIYKQLHAQILHVFGGYSKALKNGWTAHKLPRNGNDQQPCRFKLPPVYGIRSEMGNGTSLQPRRRNGHDDEDQHCQRLELATNTTSRSPTLFM